MFSLDSVSTYNFYTGVDLKTTGNKSVLYNLIYLQNWIVHFLAYRSLGPFLWQNKTAQLLLPTAPF